MANEFTILLLIGLPWLGALLVWATGDSRPRLQHLLAVIFSLAAGAVALSLIPAATDQAVLTLNVGGIFGAFTFVPDGLASSWPPWRPSSARWR
jgi:NADH-quinone oxidoreductase subunit L